MKVRPTHHHGPLRQALIEAALSEIEQAGIEGLSLRGLAEQHGAARSAPYRHFDSTQTLVLTLVEMVRAEIYEAYSSMPSARKPLDRVRGASLVYLEYARRQPNLFRLLYLDNANWQKEGWHRPLPAKSALAVYRQLFADAMPGADDEAVTAATLSCWAALHGYAQICTNDRFQQMAGVTFSDYEFVDRILLMVA